MLPGSLVLLGFFFGHYAQTLEHRVGSFILAGSLVFVVILAFYGFRKVRKHHKML